MSTVKSEKRVLAGKPKYLQCVGCNDDVAYRPVQLKSATLHLCAECRDGLRRTLNYWHRMVPN